MTQIRELAEDEVAAAFEAMRELRTGLASAEEFTARVAVQSQQGYRLVGVIAGTPDGGSPASGGPDGGVVVAVCGFRLGQNLAWGRHLYVDDLSTLPAARGNGHGGALLEWVHAEAARLGCEQVHLDSGVQPERASAHRLYFGQRYRISSYHFQRPVAT